MLAAALSFSACSGYKTEENRLSTEETAILSTALYDEHQSFAKENRAMLDGGKTAALQQGFRVIYTDTETGRETAVLLRAENIAFPGRCIFSNDEIFMENGCEIVFGEEGPVLCGGSFFERDGSLIKTLPKAENIKGESLTPEKIRWLGENMLMLTFGEHCFFYDTEEKKLFFRGKPGSSYEI